MSRRAITAGRRPQINPVSMIRILNSSLSLAARSPASYTLKDPTDGMRTHP